MKKIKIKKGSHYSNQFKPKFYCSTPTRITKTFIFTESCRYDLGNIDQLDINKLFGIGLGLRHHNNSIRLGWNYDEIQKKIAIYSYDYNYGDRYSRLLTLVPIGEKVKLEIRMNWKQNFYRVFENDKEIGSVQYEFPNKLCLKTKLGVYFGGNQKAPHTMEILELN